MTNDYYIRCMIGVYAIQNIKTGKLYVGSSIDVEVRWKAHRAKLRRHAHHNAYLQRSYEKHGPDAFVYFMIENASHFSLTEREQFWIDQLKATDSERGYNLERFVRRPLKGRTLSQEHKDKIGFALKGRKHSPESRAKLSAANKGRTLSAESRAKLKGRTLSAESRAKLSAANKGRRQTDEAKQKLSSFNKGKQPCEANVYSRLLSAQKKGHNLSKKTLEKLAELESKVKVV